MTGNYFKFKLLYIDIEKKSMNSQKSKFVSAPFTPSKLFGESSFLFTND